MDKVDGRIYPSLMRYLLLLTLLTCSLLCGCASTNRSSYKTLGSIAVIVNTAKHSYEAYRDTPPGHYDKSTDEKLKVAYEHYQRAMKVAEDAQRSFSAGTLDQPVWESMLNAVVQSASSLIQLVESFNPSFKSQ